MELLELPNEEFKEDFRNWLIEQYPKNFKNLSGYEILKSYIHFRYSSEIVFERKDFQFFVSFKREIIDEIRIWLETFQLTFEDYKIYFELFIEDISLNYKTSFEKINSLFNLYLKAEDFIIDKNDIYKDEVSAIFHKKIIENKIAQSSKIKDVVLKCIKCESLLSKTEKNRKHQYKDICISCLDIAVFQNKKKKNNLKCIQCGLLLTDTDISSKLQFEDICINCLDLSKKSSKTKEVVLNCILCESLLTDAELNRKHRNKNICINCLDIKKKNYRKLGKKKYQKERMKRDIKFKILHNLRKRILLVLHGKTKAENSMNLLGCSAEYLKKHLEEQFKDDMSWENYGIKGWHIDHIKPCASFDFSIIEEQKECFHYTNLQPLWWHENLAKSDKII
jgi:hypothetical protein